MVVMLMTVGKIKMNQFEFIPAFTKRVYFCNRPNNMVLVRFGLKSFGEFPKQIIDEFLK